MKIQTNEEKQKYLQDAWTTVVLEVHLHQGSLFRQAWADHLMPASLMLLSHLLFLALSVSALQKQEMLKICPLWKMY